MKVLINMSLNLPTLQIIELHGEVQFMFIDDWMFHCVLNHTNTITEDLDVGLREIFTDLSNISDLYTGLPTDTADFWV